jgi:hypothetical protein
LGANLWLVHRGLRYRGSKGGEGAARRAWLSSLPLSVIGGMGSDFMARQTGHYRRR